MFRSQPITGELVKLRDEILAHALDYGLDFYEVIFELCDYDTINILAAQGGFPARYPHWRFGMDYDQMSKGYRYGLQKIYEMVVNTDPCYAYLLSGNNIVDQKTVMAHVYGHADFFKNNLWFASSNRKMMDVMANHRTKIRRYMNLYGIDQVETFIDKVLSLENLLDINELFESPELVRSRRQQLEKAHNEDYDQHEGASPALRSFMKSKERWDQKAQKEVGPEEEEQVTPPRFPQKPQRNIMRFLAEYAPVEEWQSDVIAILMEEAYYYLPQRITKIMNEGWASYWHSKIMTKHALDASEIIDFADHHAGVMAMSRKQINPYKIGIELFRDIEFRWNTGRFGREYEDCQDMVAKENWSTDAGLGREKIFEVRRTYNDITFLDDFFNAEFCERQRLFTYKYNSRTGRYEIDTRDVAAIKQKLLTQLTNFGQPVIEIEDANFQNRGEMLLAHRHYGVDLDVQYAAETMKNIYHIWKRPINLATIYDEKEVIFHFDGNKMKPLK